MFSNMFACSFSLKLKEIYQSVRLNAVLIFLFCILCICSYIYRYSMCRKFVFSYIKVHWNFFILPYKDYYLYFDLVLYCVWSRRYEKFIYKVWLFALSVWKYDWNQYFKMNCMYKTNLCVIDFIVFFPCWEQSMWKLIRR